MRRKLLTMLLAGTLTLQGVTPVLAEEISAETFVSETVVAETETTEGSEESYAPETESVSIETETSSEMESAAASEAITEVDVSETELIEEEIIIGSEQGAVEEAVDLDAWEAGLEMASVAGDVAINEGNFPDAKFRNYVAANFDKNKDGVLSAQEISLIKSINVDANTTDEQWWMNRINSLKGIEYFTALTELSCKTNSLKSLDISKNTELRTLDCLGNELTSLDVSKNVKLEKLDCTGNNISVLDVRQNPYLKVLRCLHNTKITSLDVSQNTLLEELSCEGCDLASLDVSHNKNLQVLNCFGNSYNPMRKNRLTSLDVSHNPMLTRLLCGDNSIKNLDLSNNTRLEKIDCCNNQLQTLNVTVFGNLKELCCDNNQLKELNVKNNSKLKELHCGGNLLQTLDLSKNTQLTFLDARNNKLTGLNLNNTSLDKNSLYKNMYADENDREVYAAKVGSVWKINIAGLVGKQYIGNVSFTNAGMKYANGVLAFAASSLPKEITYQYDTGLPEGHVARYMTVTLQLKTCAAHKFGEYITTRQPSYATEGLAVRTCSVCGTQEAKTLPKLSQGQDTAVHTTGISGLHTGIALEAGKTVTLRPVITPANSQDPVQYASVAPNIVTVSANGVVKGIRAGSAYVYVKSGTKYVKILVKVTAGSLTAITGVRTTGSLYVGASYQLRPQRYPAGSAGVFYYKSTDPSVAVVDKNGKIIAKKKGITVITVTARNVSTTMRLTVK